MPITFISKCQAPTKTDTGYATKGATKMFTFDERCTELDDLLKSAKRKTLYEHLPEERVCKLHFDIDQTCEGKDDCTNDDARELLHESVESIMALFPELQYADFHCTSLNGQNLYTDKSMPKKKYGAYKLSFHIVVDKYTATNTENKAIAQYLQKMIPAFDTSVYSKNQTFRYGFCHKYNQRDAGCRAPVYWFHTENGGFQPKTNATKLAIDETELLYKNLIQYTTPEMCPVTVPDVCEVVEPPTLPKENTEYEIPDPDQFDESLYQLLQQLPEYARDEYTPWFRITCKCKALNALWEWDKWCSGSPSYDKEGNASTWQSITVSDEQRKTALPILKKMAIAGKGEYIQELHQCWQRDTHQCHGEFIVKHFGKNFKCVDQEKGLFYRFDKETNLWIRCSEKAMFTFLANKEYAQMLDTYEQAIYDAPALFGFDLEAGDEEEQKKTKGRMKKYLTKLRTCEDVRTVSAWGKWVFNDDRIFDSEFEQKLNSIHDHLSVANGMVNMRTGKLRPRTYDDKCSIALELEWNEDAKPDGNQHWNRFIHSIFDCEGLETAEIIEWVHQWLGYCLTGYTTQASCCVWFGAGSNGKSLLQDMLINLLKTRHGNIINTWSSKLINEMSSAGESTNGHTAELAKMEHVRIGIINELGANTALDESFKKTIDSTDGMAVRASYGQPKTIAMTLVFNFLTNVYPQHPPTEPFKRRINVVPMLARFCEESKMSKPNDKLIDYTLKHKVMQDEYHKQCILSWLVQGSMKWFANDMTLPKQPASCITYKEQFIAQMDYMSSFAYSADKKDRVAMQDIQKVISGRVSRKVPKPEIIEKMLELTKTKKMLTKVPINAGGLGEGFTNLRIITMEEEEEEEQTYAFKAE